MCLCKSTSLSLLYGIKEIDNIDEEEGSLVMRIEQSKVI